MGRKGQNEAKLRDMSAPHTRPLTMSPPMHFMFCFAAWVTALGALAFVHGESMVRHLLPWFHAEIRWLDDTYRIESLTVDREGADQVVRIVVGLARCVFVNGQAYCGDPRGLANASTLLANITMPAVLLVSVAMAWPAVGWHAYAKRAVNAPLALAFMWAFDVPFVLWASLWSLHVDAYAPDLWSPLLVWRDFLQGGGRFALAITFGVLHVYLCQVGRSVKN
jgi:hypothetical protein